MVEYSVLPIEPTFFTRSIDIQIGNQIPNINPVDINFASVYIDATSIPAPIIKYLDQPIKTVQPIKASVFSYTLNKETNALLKIINANTYKRIELKDVPQFVKNYGEYETFILDYISKIENKIIYLNCIYSNEIIMNIAKYTSIKGICVNQYGFCVKDTPEITDLFTYYIDNKVLSANTNAIKPKELIVQTDLICHSVKGISNTFASQLWLYDFLFQLASANVKSAYIDMATFNNIYSVMAFSYATRAGAVFYDSVIKYGSLLKPNIPIYITKNTSEYLISVIHKDVTEENVQIKVSVPIYTTAKLIRYICNQTILGEYGITFGELTFDGSSGIPINARTKAPSTNFVTTDIYSKDGTYTFIMDKMSIAVLSIPISSGGAYFENINDTDEGRTIVTINPNPLEGDSIPTTMTLSDFKKYYQEDL